MCCAISCREHRGMTLSQTPDIGPVTADTLQIWCRDQPQHRLLLFLGAVLVLTPWQLPSWCNYPWNSGPNDCSVMQSRCRQYGLLTKNPWPCSSSCVPCPNHLSKHRYHLNIRGSLLVEVYPDLSPLATLGCPVKMLRILPGFGLKITHRLVQCMSLEIQFA